MTRPSTPTLSTAKLDWDEQGQPLSTDFDDVYFSRASGIAESQYVFIEHNHLSQRWSALDNTKRHFTVAETGFGTGLNFLACWQAWQTNTNPNKPRLHFISVEKYPLTKTDLTRALDLFPTVKEYAEQLIQAYPPQPINGIQSMSFEQGQVKLSIYFGDVLDGLQNFAQLSFDHPEYTKQTPRCITPKVDAWFLDGFAPAKNPQMWSHELFSAMANLSKEGTTFSTFTAASFVRKGLEAVGFHCQKVKGFGNKREQLTGHYNYRQDGNHFENYTDTSTHPSRRQVFKQKKPIVAWHITDAPTASIQHCAVIGGGLAGCQTAFALSLRGISSTIIEAKSTLAEEASGNLQGVVYSKLSPDHNPLCRFNLNAQIFANQFYQHFDLFKQCGNQSGVFHLATNDKERQTYQLLAQRFKDSPDFLQWIDKKNALNIVGLNTHHGGLFIPEAGWLQPKRLCQTLASNAGSHQALNRLAEKLEFDPELERWIIHCIDSKNSAIRETLTADAVVIANAKAATRFSQTAYLPLKHIRGQVSHANARGDSRNQLQRLKTTLCGEGYIAPAIAEQYCFGASFTLHDHSDQMTEAEHVDNIKKIHSMIADVPPSLEQDLTITGGKVGFRCTAPDYFPVAGPVPHYEDFVNTYGLLRKNANRTILDFGHYHPRLYCNLAHGSKGLSYTPLMAELIASQLSGEVLPLSQDIIHNVHPARFIIRNLMRNKI